MARNAEKNKQMRDERRETIFAAAVKLFATRGLAATKVTDIARAAGMSQGLLYHYFSSKEEIFIQAIQAAFERMNNAARQLERQPLSPREKLRIATETILRGLEQSEDFAWYSTLISLASVSDAVPPEALAIIQRQREVPYKIVARIVRAGQKEGSLRRENAEQLAVVFWTTVKGLALHRAAWGSAYKAPAPSIITSIFFEGDEP